MIRGREAPRSPKRSEAEHGRLVGKTTVSMLRGGAQPTYHLYAVDDGVLVRTTNHMSSWHGGLWRMRTALLIVLMNQRTAQHLQKQAKSMTAHGCNQRLYPKGIAAMTIILPREVLRRESTYTKTYSSTPCLWAVCLIDSYPSS